MTKPTRPELELPRRRKRPVNWLFVAIAAAVAVAAFVVLPRLSMLGWIGGVP